MSDVWIVQTGGVSEHQDFFGPFETAEAALEFAEPLTDQVIEIIRVLDPHADN